MARAQILFLTGPFEGLRYQFRNINRLKCVNKAFGGPALCVTDFAKVEIVRSENVKKVAESLGFAVVGGLVAGGAGALIGATITGNDSEVVAVCHFADGRKALARMNSPMMDIISAYLLRIEENPNRYSIWENASMLWRAFHPRQDPANYGFPKPRFRKILYVCVFAVLLLAVKDADRFRKAVDAGVAVHTQLEAQRAAPPVDPCEKIKTLEDWHKASSLWRLQNEECRPR